MKKSRMLLATVIVCMLAGCASSSSMYWLNDGIAATDGRNPEQILIYGTTAIGKEYIELGTVSVSFANELNGAVYIKAIKKEAAKVGADAVVSYRQVGTRALGVAVKFQE